MFTIIYNYFGKVIQEYLPQVRQYSLYLGQAIDTDSFKTFPSIFIELSPISIDDVGEKGQHITVSAKFHYFDNIRQSYNWRNKTKDRALNFLDFFDVFNSVMMLKTSDAKEYGVQSIRRTNMDLLPVNTDVKEAAITYEFEFFDNSFLQEKIYQEVQDIQVNIDYEDEE